MKKACSILLIVCSYPLPAFAQAARPPDTPMAAPITVASMDLTRVRVETAARRQLSPRPWSLAQTSPGGSTGGVNKPLLFAGLAAIAAGATLAAFSYGEESYSYTSCPGCNPPVTSTNTRETYSDGMYWGGIAVASGGAVLVLFSFLRR